MFESGHVSRILGAAASVALLSVSAWAGQNAKPSNPGDLPARVIVLPEEVVWQPLRDFAGAELIVRGPEGEMARREFGRGEFPSFSLENAEAPLPDGSYFWELRLVPELPTALREGLAEAVENDDPARTAELNRIHGIAHQQLVQTGQFFVRAGRIEADADDLAARDPAGAPKLATSPPQPRGPLAAFDVSGDWTVTGDLGIGTDTPSQELDIVDSSPAIQMEDSSSAFSWFINGNATGFDVRRGGNMTSDRVFFLDPAAPRPSLWISSTGRWGNGTSVPTSALHVRRTDGTAQLLVEEASPVALQRSVFRLRNRGGIRFDFEDTSGGSIWQFVNSGSLFRIINPGSPGLEFQLDKNGNLTLEGDVTANGILLTSDLEAKENLSPVDSGEVLERVLRLPISEWNLKNRPAARHIGPTAQDFHHIVRVGADERRISPIDTAGAALAAVQGLHALLLEKDRELENLRGALSAQQAELQSLKARLEEIQTLLGRR